MKIFGAIILSLLIFSNPGFGISVFQHTPDLSTYEFDALTSKNHGISLVDFLKSKNITDRYEQLDLSDKSLDKDSLLKQMESQPMFLDDLKIWMLIYNRQQDIDKNRSLFLQSLLRKSRSVTAANTAITIPNFLMKCHGIFMIDGSWMTAEELRDFIEPLDLTSIHQWNHFSNCSTPVTEFGTWDQFHESILKIHQLPIDQLQNIKYSDLSVAVLSSFDLSDSDDGQRSLQKSDRKPNSLSWIIPLAITAIGFSAYELRGKQITWGFGSGKSH